MIRPELKEAICPYMRTMLSASDAPPWNAEAQEMSVEDLVGFVRSQPGNGSLEKVLKFFAIFNHGLGDKGDRIRHFLLGSGGRFSTRLTGSDGDHEGGSLIYNKATGEFDEEQFDAFTSFASGRETMTVDELAQAIADANQRHHGSPKNAVQSAGEFALLCALLGDDNGTVKVQDMHRLFAANEFPEGARANLGSRTSRQWFDFALRLIHGISAIHHHEGEMSAERLTELFKILFGPLLAAL